MAERGLLLLVTGVGRSGTSTVTGALARLGYVVPQPVIQASEANPRGFYESWWPVHLHNKIVGRAGLAKSDGQPDVAELAAAAVRASDARHLQTWLGRQFEGADRVVVKDPRAAVLPGLWAQAATAVGVDIGYLTMLRHPSEVIGSRAAYYQAEAAPSPAQATRIATAWLSHNLALERHTRDQRRALLQYAVLLADWRTALREAGESLGLELTALLDETTGADVDAFVEPTLRRHRPGWDGLIVPDPLRVLLEEAWSTLSRLDGCAAHDAAVEDELDQIGTRYARLYAEAEAIASHRTATAVEKAVRRGRREGRESVAQPGPSDDARSVPPLQAESLIGRLARRIGRERSR